jgi:hypothetical protein
MFKINRAILALALFASQMNAPQAAPGFQWVQAAIEDDLSAGFTQLNVGMSALEVMALMKREPQRKEVNSHLGLEIQRLVWTQWTTGSTYQVVLVAGRLVSKAAEKKTMLG